MKYLIASDVHGSSYYAQEIVNQMKKEQADMLVLLGDIYNHGPRNPLPKDYNPLKVAEILNSVKANMIVVKGNCDSEVDTLISEFDFINELCLVDNGKRILCTHGHNYNKDSLPKTKYDAIIYGHFHTGFVMKGEQCVVANTGSASLPKNQTKNSYIILENGKIILKSIEGDVIDEQSI